MMDSSRLRSAFYGALSVIVPIAMYIKQSGGLAGVNIWDLIIFLGAAFGGTTAGYHVPSKLAPQQQPSKTAARNEPTLAAAIKRIEHEPPTVIAKIANKSRSVRGGGA